MSSDSEVRSVRSIVLTGFGDTSQLKVEDWPLPTPAPGEVEVLVHFCGMNFTDIYTRLGIANDKEPPFVLGTECCGIVQAVGHGGNDDDNLAPTSETFAEGDRVVCYDSTGGLFRDRVVVSKTKCFRLPEYINLRVGGGIFVSYVTAYFSLFKMGNLKEGETVFIQSCGGAIGWAATQLAHTVSEVTVIGTTSPSKRTDVIANGVDYAFGYSDYPENIRPIRPNGIDVVIENQGGEHFNTCQHLLKPFGRIVSIGANCKVTRQANQPTQSMTVIPENLVMQNQTVCGINLGLLCETENEKVRQAFAHICSMIKEKSLKPRIDTVWKFDKVVEGTLRIEERKNIGKVLLTLF